ncbi:Protein farnesyltransferase subunit beta [Hypsizygus marmoreus]|uniref:Protein farnesyltransferase subunit beta n=1 Tax=Hypsizygus marmoreus TaxID=39966 RepID=A0A369JCB0_HYPMA|nr:Protein farnesyltransferase subunit beta [Hypsizygus marmoreus]
MTTANPNPPTPRPTPTDGFPTATSQTQAETEAILLKHIPQAGADAPVLAKSSHMQFLVRNLVQGFPARYMSQDASQPWLLFWTIQAFSILQVGLDPGNKQRVIDKTMAAQHPDGGFGGGPRQAAHLLPTYAAVCTLAIVGRSGPGGGWDQIDREKMYKFFMSLKQPDGSFLVAHHAEVDVRGIYCLLVTATLLDLLTPELVAGTASFIASCQTYEGGFSSSSQSYYTTDNVLLSTPRPPLGEAHGGYTFCALASWVLLHPFMEVEKDKPTIDARNLLRWLVNMQGTEIELGGFKGRTNKLVDGCYSWWCGGAFSLLEAFGVGGSREHIPSSTSEGEWDDADDSLFNRKALQEYILLAGQHPAGGLRDKPPKNSDAYHTLYCLSGLSAAQHHIFLSSARRDAILDAWVANPAASPDLADDIRKHVFADSLSWTEEEGGSLIVGGKDNRVNATHPVFNLTITHTEGLMSYFYKQTLPPRVKASSNS